MFLVEVVELPGIYNNVPPSKAECELRRFSRCFDGRRGDRGPTLCTISSRVMSPFVTPFPGFQPRRAAKLSRAGAGTWPCR